MGHSGGGSGLLDRHPRLAHVIRQGCSARLAVGAADQRQPLCPPVGHCWATSSLEGLHLADLPTTAYVFDMTQPCGWADAQVRPNGIALRLNALGRQHPAQGKSVDLAWRE